MIERMNGGDLVVLTTKDTDEHTNFFFNNFKTLNSVETIVIDS